MSVLNVQDLSGDTLAWAVCYAQAIQEILGDRRDRRPLKADHAQAMEVMEEIDVMNLTPEQLLAKVIIHRIAVFEDNGRWYATPSEEIAMWRRDLDGEEALAMIFEEDAIQGDSYEVAVKRCFVRMTLGHQITIPNQFPVKNAV